MKDELQNCLEIITGFPTIYRNGKRSPQDILKQSNYENLSSIVTVDNISEHLKSNKDLIEPWIQYTEDIRYNPAWGFQAASNSSWQVFFMDIGKQKEEYVFNNPFDACARMIKETMDMLTIE